MVNILMRLMNGFRIWELIDFGIQSLVEWGRDVGALTGMLVVLFIVIYM